MDWFWQVLLATIMVVLLLYGSLRVLNWAMGNRMQGGRLQILEFLTLSRRSHLAIVRVEDESFLLGITDHNVTLIERLKPGGDNSAPDGHTSSGRSFSDILANMAGRRDS